MSNNEDALTMNFEELDLQAADLDENQHIAGIESLVGDWIKEHQETPGMRQAPMEHGGELRMESTMLRETTHNRSWYDIDPRNNTKYDAQRITITPEYQRYQDDVHHVDSGIVGRNKETGQVLRATGHMTGQHGPMTVYKKVSASKPTKRHRKAKKLVCKVCMQEKSTTTTLRNHMKIHTGDRDERCGRCLRGFISKANRKAHEKKCNFILRPKKKWELMYQNTQKELNKLAL